MAINKFQRSRLTFDLSAKVTHIGVPSRYQNIVFSETTWPIELKFHMETPYVRLAKMYANCFGHMTKMATMPIYCKTPLKIFFSRTRRLMTLGLVIKYWGCGPYQVCTNYYFGLTLIYFTARSNLIPNAFILGKS